MYVGTRTSPNWSSLCLIPQCQSSAPRQAAQAQLQGELEALTLSGREGAGGWRSCLCVCVRPEKGVGGRRAMCLILRYMGAHMLDWYLSDSGLGNSHWRSELRFANFIPFSRIARSDEGQRRCPALAVVCPSRPGEKCRGTQMYCTVKYRIVFTPAANEKTPTPPSTARWLFC